MWKSDSDTTAIPVLDRFTGDHALVILSEKLMEWDEAPVTDQEIADALGPGMVEAFRYTQQKLVGKVRKVTGEPSLCHSADVSIRASALGYGTEVIQACLLHDVAEDTSSNFTQLPGALAEIAQRFSPELAWDVSLLTNRYQLIFAAASQKVRPNIEPTRRGLDAYRAAIDVLRWESRPELVETFGLEFASIAELLEGDAVDLDEAALLRERDSKYTFAQYIQQPLYALYIDDIVRDAVYRVTESGGAPPVPLVVKSVDIIDNVRTSEVSNKSALDRLVRKAETILDAVQAGFIDVVPPKVGFPSTIPALHRTVQIRLVDQIKLRRRAVADNFSETRFANLVRFLVDEGNRLNAKYNIPRNRIEVTESLENEVRSINRSYHLPKGEGASS